MTLSVTITAPNTVNEYGLILVNGSTYSLADDLARSLVAQGKASWSVSQSVTEAASPTSVPYKSGIVDLAQMGASKGARSKQIANAFVAGMARAGHMRLSDPGTYVLDASTASIVCQSNCTIEICAGVTLDVSPMSAPCFTATSKSNIRLTGDGKIVCSAASAPSFTSVSGLEVSVRIEDGSGNALLPALSLCWVPIPSIWRLRLTGTGTCTMDAKDSLGNITANVATFSATSATDQIEFPYAGDDAVSVRFTLTGTCIAGVL